MSFVLVVLWTVIGAVAFAVIGTELGPAFGFRHMEGSSAIFGVVTAAPLGAITGAAAGAWVSSRFRASRRKIAGYSVASIALAFAAGVAFEYASNDMLARPAWLLFEVRSPGTAMPEWSQVSGRIRSNGTDGSEISYYGTGQRSEGAGVVLQGQVEVSRHTTDASSPSA